MGHFSFTFFSHNRGASLNCDLCFEDVWVENFVRVLTALQWVLLVAEALISEPYRVSWGGLICDDCGRSVCSLSPTALRPVLLDTMCVCMCVRGASGRMSLK